MDSMIYPNFFIVGAPRCGTTALANYLGEHPGICFSVPKETQFFCTDMPRIRYVDDKEHYLQMCFDHCKDSGKMIGEGSVWHLYSQDAIRNILHFNPKAKIIVMVRSPVDLCVSLHAKWLELLWENEPSFEKAWHLQKIRAKGESVPPRCKDFRVLLYERVARLGEQVRRLFDIVPVDQRMVIVFDDFISDAAGTYRQVLDFLGIEDDGRKDFQRVNESIKPRNQRLWELACDPPQSLVHLVEKGKRVLGIQKLGLLERTRRLLVAKSDNTISYAIKLEMAQRFHEDVFLLGKLLGRDFSHWVKME